MSVASDDRMRRGAALMASGTAVSRLLGLLRAVVLIAAIGATGQAADAFAVANKLPNVLYMLLVGGVLNAVLVPQVVRAYKRNVGQEYVDRLLSFGFVVLAVLTVVMTIAAPLLVSLYAQPGNQAQHDLAVTFAYWCIPQIFFYGAYALLGQVLNARHSFGPYMWAPVVNNLVSIAGFGAFIVAYGSVPGSGLARAARWDGGQVALFAGAATLGVVAQAVVLLPALRRAGVHYRFRWGLRGSGLGRAGTVATWTLVGLGIGQLGYLVVSRVASEAPGAAREAARAVGEAAGAVAGNAAYDAAFTIFMLPHSLVTVSLATALFTRLAERAHERDTDGVRASFSSGVRVVGVFTVLAAAVVAVLAQPVTRLVMPTERPATVSAVAAVVVAMVLGLPAFGAWSMAQRVYFAYEDTRGMVPVQALMAAVVVLGTLLSRAVLDPAQWVVGIGASMSLSYVVGAVAGLWHLRRRLGSVDGGRIAQMYVRATVAAAVAAGVGILLLQLLDRWLGTGVVGAVTECVAVGTVMLVGYVALLRALRVDELDDLLRPVLARAGRLGRLAGPARSTTAADEARSSAPALDPSPVPEARVPRTARSRPVRGPMLDDDWAPVPPLPDEDWDAPDAGRPGGPAALGTPADEPAAPPRAPAPDSSPAPDPHAGAAPRTPRTHRSRPHYPPDDPRHRPAAPARFDLEEHQQPPTLVDGDGVTRRPDQATHRPDDVRPDAGPDDEHRPPV